MVFWFWTAACACVVAVAIAASMSFVRIRVRYSRSGKLDQLIVIVHAVYGLYRLKLEIPTIRISSTGVAYDFKQKSDAPGAGREGGGKGRLINMRSIRRLRLAAKEALRSVRQLKGWMFAGLRKVECTRYRMDIRIGTGDAASTGVATGLCWSVMGLAAGVLDRFVKLRTHPHGEVVPVYGGVELSVVWEADFRIRMGTAAVHALRVLPRLQYGAALRRAYRNWRAIPGQTQH